jgi:toxin ParE1/3/4
VTALAYIERVERHLQSFDLAAARGSRRDDVRPGLRVVGFERSLTTAFHVDEQQVTILRLFRRGRNWTQDAL